MPEVLLPEQEKIVAEKLEKITQIMPDWEETFEFGFKEALQNGEVGKAIQMLENTKLSEEERNNLIKILQEEPSIEELLEISESPAEAEVEQDLSVEKISNHILGINRPVDEVVQYIIAARGVLSDDDFEVLHERANNSESIKKALNIYLEAETKNISQNLKETWGNLDKTYSSRLIQVIWGIVNGTIKGADDFLEGQVGGDMDSSTPYSVGMRLVDIPIKITKYIATIPTFFMKYMGNQVVGMPEMFLKKAFAIWGNRNVSSEIAIKEEKLRDIIDNSNKI